MEIAATSGPTNVFRQQQIAAEQDIQNVFSSILKAAGRQGYASAETTGSPGVVLATDLAANLTTELATDQLEEDEPPVSVDTLIQESIGSWFSVEAQEGRYAHRGNASELAQQFGDLLVKANDEGAYVDPKAFLGDLSSDELELLRQVNSLAAPINVETLSEEGALNLLLPPASQVDINGDGLTTTGLANSIRFPSSSTPNDVADAWYEATADMDFGERMFYEIQMVMPVMTANMVLNDDGTYSHTIEPGEPGYQNPMLEIDYSYSDAARARLDYLEAYKNEMDPARYEKDTQFWSTFKQLLNKSDT